MPSVIITGAAGFLGSHLCERFLRESYNVIGIDNFCTGMTSNIQEVSDIAEELRSPDRTGASWRGRMNFVFIEADIVKPWDWINKIPQSWLEDLKYVLHFASPASPPLYQKLSIETIWANTIGLERAILFANQYKARVIFASTSEIYGDPEISPQPETYRGCVNSFGERSCYDESKRLGESIIFSYNKKYSTKHGLVRIFNTYGPRMNPNDGRVIVNFLTQAMKNKALSIYGNGKQTRSFCYVDDLVEGIYRYTKKNITEPVNLGSQFEFNIEELVEIIKSLFPDKKLNVEHHPLPQDDPQQRRPDTKKAQNLLDNWAPKVELREGLKRMLNWLE